MIVDYRIYLTLYALAVIAWVASILLMHTHGHRFVNRWMASVASAAVAIGLANYLDWLWS